MRAVLPEAPPVGPLPGVQPRHRVSHYGCEIDIVDRSPGARPVAGDPVQNLGRAAACQHADPWCGANRGSDAVRSQGADHRSGLRRSLAPCGREDEAGPGSLDGAPQRLHALDDELTLDHRGDAIGGRLRRLTARHHIGNRRVQRQAVRAEWMAHAVDV
eukprot:scaffold20662_cov101-Isochrysis_galbana.AAC.1